MLDKGSASCSYGVRLRFTAVFSCQLTNSNSDILYCMISFSAYSDFYVLYRIVLFYLQTQIIQKIQTIKKDQIQKEMVLKELFK